MHHEVIDCNFVFIFHLTVINLLVKTCYQLFLSEFFIRIIRTNVTNLLNGYFLKKKFLKENDYSIVTGRHTNLLKIAMFKRLLLPF